MTFLNCFQDAEVVEAIFKYDLEHEPTFGESRGASPYGDTNEGLFLLPGDEPPQRNYTLSSPPSSSNHRWFLPPLNNSGISVASSLSPVNDLILRKHKTL